MKKQVNKKENPKMIVYIIVKRTPVMINNIPTQKSEVIGNAFFDENLAKLTAYDYYINCPEMKSIFEVVLLKIQNKILPLSLLQWKEI